MKKKSSIKLIHSIFYLMLCSLLIGVSSCDEDDPVLSSDATLSALTVNGVSKAYSILSSIFLPRIFVKQCLLTQALTILVVHCGQDNQ